MSLCPVQLGCSPQLGSTQQPVATPRLGVVLAARPADSVMVGDPRVVAPVEAHSVHRDGLVWAGG
jgi:hypothetical protein